MRKRCGGKNVWSLFGCFVIIALLWNTRAILPVKILVVFFHEISHGIAAILTGGSVESITVSADQGGLAMTRGGSRFLTLNAGYLGSLLWGSLLIIGSSWARRDKLLTGALGLMMGFVTIFYVRNMFGFAFGAAMTAALLAAARWLHNDVNDFILKVIGVTSCGYAVLDIWSDVMVRSSRSDARMLAELTLIPASVWGAAWIVLSLFVIFQTMRVAASLGKRRY